MGLRDRILDYVAKVFMPVPDHPARGGMTGEQTRDDEEDGDAGDADAGGSGEETDDSGGTTDGTR